MESHARRIVAPLPARPARRTHCRVHVADAGRADRPARVGRAWRRRAGPQPGCRIAVSVARPTHDLDLRRVGPVAAPISWSGARGLRVRPPGTEFAWASRGADR